MTANTPEKLDGINQTLAEQLASMNTIMRQMLDTPSNAPDSMRAFLR